jgi:hypothetical protein
MERAKLEYTTKQVDAAGHALVDPSVPDEEMDQALKVIGNWRACHYHPLLTFRIGLQRRAAKVYPASLVAQRLKRLSSIKAKLRRLNWLTLSTMQDIAGCRAVVGNVTQVQKLVDLYFASDIKHTLLDLDDYIVLPKHSGYRGVHLVYSYFSDKNEAHNGLKIEIQIRSPLQHAWATAVETVDRFTLQGLALKSGKGNKRWRRFFAYMSAYIAMRERSNPVPNMPTKRAEIKDGIRRYAAKLDVENQLLGFRSAIDVIESPGLGKSYLFLVQLDTQSRNTVLWGYGKNEIREANEHYFKLELSGGRGKDQVLVYAKSIFELKRAYPNYFADTGVFLAQLKHALAS